MCITDFEKVKKQIEKVIKFGKVQTYCQTEAKSVGFLSMSSDFGPPSNLVHGSNYNSELGLSEARSPLHRHLW